MQHQDFENLFESYTLVQTMNAEIDKFKKNMNDIDLDNSLFYSIEDIQRMTAGASAQLKIYSITQPFRVQISEEKS